MTKLNWPKVNDENTDALRREQGYGIPGKPSLDVATSQNGEEHHINKVPFIICPLCPKETRIPPGEIRRHKMAKHSAQKWPVEKQPKKKKKKKKSKKAKPSPT